MASTGGRPQGWGPETLPPSPSQSFSRERPSPGSSQRAPEHVFTKRARAGSPKPQTPRGSGLRPGAVPWEISLQPLGDTGGGTSWNRQPLLPRSGSGEGRLRPNGSFSRWDEAKRTGAGVGAGAMPGKAPWEDSCGKEACEEEGLRTLTQTHSLTRAQIHTDAHLHMHSKTHSLGHTHSHFHTQTHTFAHSLSHSYIHTCVSQTQTFTHTDTCSHTETHTPSHSYRQHTHIDTLSHFHSHTCTHTHTQTQTQTFTLTCTLTQTLAQTQMHSHTFTLTHAQSHTHALTHTLLATDACFFSLQHEAGAI